jgi:hypothetical protein
MARRGTRKGGVNFFKRIWAPFGHLLMATGESSQKVGSTAGKIVKESIGAVEGVGKSFAKHSNNAVRNLTRRRGRRAASRRSSRRTNGMCKNGSC